MPVLQIGTALVTRMLSGLHWTGPHLCQASTLEPGHSEEKKAGEDEDNQAAQAAAATTG